MCRLAEIEFPIDTATPKAARQWVTGLLERWELTELVETASLLISEVVTNAMQHAGSAPTVTAAVAEGILEVGVTDRDPEGWPHESMSGDPMAVGGRGLAIVDVLSDDWGTAFVADGKQVWFRLNCIDWSHSTECLCHGDHLHGVVLQSGLRVLVNQGPWDLSAPE